jgi:hypothetical protein
LALSRTHSSAAAQKLIMWGMVLAAYPFLGSIATALGRLIKLQHAVHVDELQKRLRAQFGDREHVSRIVRFDMSSFLDWGILKDGKQPGVYLPVKQLAIKDDVLLAWLAEAVLVSTGRTQMALNELCTHPALFPFATDALSAAVFHKNPRLRLERQGLNEEYVFLEKRSAVIPALLIDY